MDASAVVKNLYQLAQKPENRAAIVKDQGCLPGLVLFLSDKDIEVVLMVLKTLQLLAEHVPNRKVMHNEVGMVALLKDLMQGGRFSKNPEVKILAFALHSTIQSASAHSTQRRIHVASQSQKFFVGSSNKKAKLIVLQITGLQEDTKKTCEECLLKVKGLVSFTFNIPKQRCTVRVIPTVTAEILCNSIEKSNNLKAEQVIRNKSGEEVLVSFGQEKNVAEEKAKLVSDLPSYLPEEDPVETSKTAVARPGDKDSGSSGWFSGVSSFISNSLYW